MVVNRRGLLGWLLATSSLTTPALGQFNGQGFGFSTSSNGPSLALNFLSGTLDQRINFSRASNATQYDSTGALTYSPNNLMTYSNTFTNGVWINSNIIVTTGVSDPFGGSSASTITAGSSSASIYNQSPPGISVSINYLNSLWIRRRSGSGTITYLSANNSSHNVTSLVTSSWSQIYVNGPGGNGFVTGCYIGLAVLGDAVDIYGGTSSTITYETTPRPQDQVITTSGAYYGPRFDYNPNTLAPMGLLIEGQRTNLLLNNTTLSTQTVTVTAQAYTLSFYGTGTVVLSGVFVGTLTGSGAFPTRSTLTFTPTAGALVCTVTGTVGYGQIEAGAFATSVIITAGVAATRAADVATLPVGSWFNATAGSWFAQFVNEYVPSSTNPRIIGSQSASNLSPMFVASSGKPSTNDTNATLTFGTAITANAVVKAASTWVSNVGQIEANGGTVVSGSQTTGFGGLVSNGVQFLGDGNGNQDSGWLQNVQYWPRALSSAELQAVTT